MRPIILYYGFQEIKKLSDKFENEQKHNQNIITNLELKIKQLNKDSNELLEKKLSENQVNNIYAT